VHGTGTATTLTLRGLTVVDRSALAQAASPSRRCEMASSREGTKSNCGRSERQC
jgi:hypothetical protein